MKHTDRDMDTDIVTFDPTEREIDAEQAAIDVETAAALTSLKACELAAGNFSYTYLEAMRTLSMNKRSSRLLVRAMVQHVRDVRRLAAAIVEDDA